jgi:hypothetical protein
MNLETQLKTKIHSSMLLTKLIKQARDSASATATFLNNIESHLLKLIGDDAIISNWKALNNIVAI